MESVEFVCLANSWKHGGRCIAGKLKDDPRVWLRPVSSRPGHELNENERRYADGTEPAVLDVIRLELGPADPHDHQRENWRLPTPPKPPLRVGRLPANELPRFVDFPQRLWVNGYSSSRGVNDRMPVDVAREQAGSLYLIEVDGVTVTCHNTTEERPQLRASFDYHGVPYDLVITDPEYQRRWMLGGKPSRRRLLGPVYLTVSLGEELDGYCYKLVAAVVRFRSVLSQSD